MLSHEIVHMWFGNIVTPEEWGYLWLKEGFAQFYGIYFTDMVVSDKKNADRKRLQMYINARNSDRDIKYISSTALTSRVYTFKEYNDMWKDVAYNKSIVDYSF